MNQIVTNSKNSKTIMQVKNHKLKVRLAMRAAFLMLCAVLFALPAMAQEHRNVLMQNGSTTLTVGEVVDFYDSHGPSEASDADGNKMRVNYWDKWYVTNEANGNGYIYTFNAPEGYDVKVEFKSFTAYGWSDEGNYQSVPPVYPYNCAPIGQWAFRVNDDYLYAYQGTSTIASNLIGAYTGNTENEFSIIAEGAITFKFVSNLQFREEGWYAEVTAVKHEDFEPTPPFIRRSTCSDDIELIPTTLGSTLYYTTGDQTPNPGIPYNNTPITWPEGNNLTVNAIAMLDGVSSDVATATFTDPDDRIPHINTDAFAPTIDRVAGENKVSIYCPQVPSGLNETFFVSYTTDGSVPSRINGTIVYFTYAQIAGAQATYYGGNDRTYVFDWTTPNTTFKAKVFAFSCTEEYMESPMDEYTFTNVYVPAPTIVFTPNSDPATASTTLSCTLSGATIYYTTDGSDPTTSSTVQTYNGVFDVNAGTTVRAYATMTGNYTASNTVSDIYVPTNSNGEPQNGVYGGVVLLDDREPHTLSYYTEESPIHSLNPRDIKITYFGNSPAGRTTMTDGSESNVNTPSSSDFNTAATGVKVNHDANADQFLYLKTLEAANEDGSGNYPYTMIPNPFQVRPKYSGATTMRTFIVTLKNRDDYNNWYGYGSTPATVIVGFSDGTSEVLYGPNVASATATETYSFTKAVGIVVTVTFNPGNQQYPSYCQTAIAYDDGEEILPYTNGSSSSSQLIQFNVSASSGSVDAKYRGFYAWRIKSLSSGLAITGKSVGGLVYADEEITFETSKEEGNEVEFEALWAQAYVTNSTSTTGLNTNVGYERNFMVLGSDPGTQSQTVTLGNSANTYDNGRYVPLFINRGNGYGYSISQQIYTASEIGAAGAITSLAFRVQSAQSSNRTLHIYMTSTSQTAFDYNSEWGAYESVAQFASGLVFSGTVNFNQTGWKTITLDTPFEYDGASNILVTVFDATGTYMNTSPRFYTYSGAAVYNSRTSAFPEEGYYFAVYSSNYKPQIQFIIANNPLSELNVPLVITTYNPDGTGGSSTVALSNGINCGADLKFENIKLDAISIDSDGHDLVFGRGVTPANSNGVCASVVKGMGTGSSNALDYTMRLESGVIQSFYPGYSNGTTVATFSNTYSVRAILGSDYDRANNDNGKLSISPSTHAGEIYGGNRMHMTNPSNKENLTFDWTIKSGKFHDGILGAGEGGDQSIYFGSSQAGGSSNDYKLGYIGKRRATIEGGEFASIAGGMNQDDEDTYSTYGSPNVKDMVKIRMRGGNVRGAIYGAAAFAGAVGGRTFVITGGNVLGWIAGGCNGTRTTGGELYGDSYIYFGGNAQVGNANGGNHVGGDLTYEDDGVTYYGINGADGGIIFGAGCGINPTDSNFAPNGDYQTNTVGRVNNSSVVIADEAIVWRELYGGGNFGYVRADGTSTINILGGTVKGNVFGGSNSQQAQTVNIAMTDGKVDGNIYGGSNTWGTTNNLATINVSGGTVKNVFGGGLGASTVMADDVFVTVSGGTINENVYGGGQLGVVGTSSTSASTDVTISGGEVKGSVFGAGLGTANNPSTTNPTAPTANANIYGNTNVTISGGTVTKDVFGGGQNGSVAIDVTGKKSTVAVTGGTINGSVYGGGSKGFNNSATVLNISYGVIKGSVFGGALGTSGNVYVNGTHTVNVKGGDNGIPEIDGSIYGGSRLANDGDDFTLKNDDFTNSSKNQLSSVINISGARIKEHVYAAGYYGRCFGSVYVNIGTIAVDSTTVALGNNTADKSSNKNRIFIEGSVWAGGDWGVFTGDFGGPTITGNSNIFVDGTGYNVTSTTYTETDYLGIGMSILGCGTTSDAGKQNRNLLVRNYGTPVTSGGTTINPVSGATRELNSIQRFKNVTFHNAHLSFKGEGMVTSLNTTEKYSLYSIANDTYTGNVYVANGSTLVMNYPASELNSFRSVTCSNPYANTPTYSEVTRDALYGSTLNGTSDNKVRVNGGSYVEVKYKKGSTQTYGELQGFFHLMSSKTSGEATCAYARPKQATDSPIDNEWDNPDDGGFLSYDAQYNLYDANGHEAANNVYQLPYENHAPKTRDDSQYFRIWRFGGNHHNIDGIFTVQQIGTSSDDDYAAYQTVAVTLQLPAWRTRKSYYRFDRVGDPGSYFTQIDYGIDVMTFNAANINNTANPTAIEDDDANWMYYNDSTQTTAAHSSDCPEIGKLSENPDMNFGLVIKPGTAMADTTGVNNYIICSSSDSYIAESMRYDCSDYLEMPSVTFILTYRNDIHSNTTWDPITIPLVQCDSAGAVKEYVNINLTVNTMTDISSTFKTQVYAIMNNGNALNVSTQQTITLPTFALQQTENMDLSSFTLVSTSFVPDVALSGDNSNGYIVNPNGTVTYKTKNNDFDINSFGLTAEAVLTPDNTDDWRNVQGEIDGGPCAANGTHNINQKIGESGGRTSVSLAFNLYYCNTPFVQDVTRMGTVTFTFKFDHYAAGTDPDGDGIKEGTFKVEVEVYRKGQGVNFFVDGVNGKDEIDNEKNRGHYPNYAAKSVEFVLSRLGFTAGDNIFIVNQVDVAKGLRYDGSKKQSNVNIWRYPGNHTLKSDAPLIVGNNDNKAYTGLMFNLKSGAQLTVIGTKIDGMYGEAASTTPNTHIFPVPQGVEYKFNGEAAAPVFKVNSGAKLVLNTNSRVQNNYNKPATGTKDDEGNAGGVYVASDAILAMNGQTTITSNYNDVVGGVYMDGSMIVSDDVVVYNNKKSPTGAQSNVWLTNGSGTGTDIKVIQIGNASQSSFGPLTENAKIGIDKEYGTNAYMVDGYMPVVYTEEANDNYVEDYLNDPYNSNNDDNANNDIILHDLGKYKLMKYTPDNYLYWLSTWVTFQDWNPRYENDSVEGYNPNNMDVSNIDTPEKLAWFISMVNGENGATANDFHGVTIKIKDDISMDGHIWVPIGTPNHPFKGTFEGNGHVITDMYASLMQDNMGMFGYTENATIQNAVMKTDFSGTNANLGTVVGTMNGGIMRNVEGAGSISNKLNNSNMGGLVGNNVGGTIISAFAVADMTGGANMGGLVGMNTGNLLNAYSNVDFAKLDGQTTNIVASGLVAENAASGMVENCYVIEGNHSAGTFYSFTKTNNGKIKYCYVSKASTASLVSEGGSGIIIGEGTYDSVKDRKELDYMYFDNAVEADASVNYYVADTVTYKNGCIDRWPGLLSTLNQWVEINPLGLDSLASWLRPTTDTINNDLPVLAFPKDNAMGTTDGKFLRYGSNVNANGIDGLLSIFNDNGEGDAEPEANIFFYGAATGVANVPGENVNVFINEDAVLIQAEGAGDFINTTVGITFDNSDHGQHAVDNQGDTLTYDWHMMSTPLQNAAFGITYKEGASLGYGQPVDIDAMVNGYFPNGLPMGAEYEEGVKWDFYTYYEPQYHWINFKRSINNHWHYDVINHTHPRIEYTEADQTQGIFTPGKGYMMAISQDSYMNSTGKLNKGDVTIALTNAEPTGIDFNKGWNLVGNPYQAYLDLSTLGAAGYKAFAYNADLGLYSPFVMEASENPATLADCIHPHQGFFLYALNSSVTFTPSMATTEKTANSYFRGDKVNYPLVNIFAENERGNRDMTIIEFNRPEIGGAPEIQGLRNANFHIAASLDGQGYGLLFAPEGTDRVPVRFYTHENGTFTLTWETMHGNFTSLLLVDNMTGTITDMLRSDHYTFDATIDDYASRFYITFAVTDVEEYNEGDNDFAWFDGSEWVINGKGTLDVVDVLGRTVYSARLTDDQNRVSLNNVAKGVYLLRVSEGNSAKVQKVVVR
jgi:hypothetical protein